MEAIVMSLAHIMYFVLIRKLVNYEANLVWLELVVLGLPSMNRWIVQLLYAMGA
jgi:hypothetical protein